MIRSIPSYTETALGDRLALIPLKGSPVTFNDFLYLMCPYTHPEKTERDYRANTADLCSAILLESTGCSLFSPISHSHTMAEVAELIRPGCVHWKKWMEIDLKILEVCDSGMVILIPGWTKSNGVATEIRELHSQGKRIWAMDPNQETEPQYYEIRLISMNQQCISTSESPAA